MLPRIIGLGKKQTMNRNDTVSPQETHPFWKSLLYHLLPGVPVLVFYLWMAPVLLTRGFPAAFTLCLAIPLVLIPIQLGVLLTYGFRKNRRISLKGVLCYQDKGTFKDYLIYSTVIVLWSGIVFGLLQKTLAAFLQEHVFSFLPDWMLRNAFEGSRPVLTVTVILVMVFGNILGPLTEELYFRGFLLPRIRGSSGKKAILNAFLFALYHFWSPWDLVVRTIAVLPVAYVAVKKRNLYLGMTAHIVLNVLSSLSLFALL